MKKTSMCSRKKLQGILSNASLKSTADMINYFFFFRKQASYSKTDFFFLNLSMITSIKSARRRYTVQVEADRIMKSVTG